MHDCLQSISSHKASGIDKLSPRLLKLAAPIIAPSIAKLINYSFNTASFPQRWKTAKVSPLFKGGDSEDLNNYRPISVLPVLSKVIERHVHDSLSSCLCENNLIYSEQSGFWKLHSTETALIRIIDDLLFNLDNDRVSGTGGSRVVQVICRNHSNFFQTLFLSSMLLFTKSIILLVLWFIMK